MITTSSKTLIGPRGELSVIGFIEYEGHTFQAGGGFISDAYCYCYPNDDGTVSLWSGPLEGATARKTCTYQQWNPLSHQHETRVCWRIRLADGRQYSGRNASARMLLKAKRTRGGQS